MMLLTKPPPANPASTVKLLDLELLLKSRSFNDPLYYMAFAKKKKQSDKAIAALKTDRRTKRHRDDAIDDEEDPLEPPIAKRQKTQESLSEAPFQLSPPSLARATTFTFSQASAAASAAAEYKRRNFPVKIFHRTYVNTKIPPMLLANQLPAGDVVMLPPP